MIVALLLLTNIAFYRWMKTPMREGARLLQQIDGLVWYRGVAEKQELDAGYRPGSDPKRFAQHLPYALALDVEPDWAVRFSEALTSARFEQRQRSSYRDRDAARGARSFVFSRFGRSFASSIFVGLDAARIELGPQRRRRGGW
nr:hypothetical protein [Panacagrimonas sp.]